MIEVMVSRLDVIVEKFSRFILLEYLIFDILYNFWWCQETFFEISGKKMIFEGMKERRRSENI